MGQNKILHHFTFEINRRKWGWGWGWGEMLIYDIAGSVLPYTVPHTQNYIYIIIFITYQLFFEDRDSYYTNLSQINSQECIGHIKQHFMTTRPHQWHSRVCNMLHQTLGSPRPLTRAIWFNSILYLL